jgi:hypothetical protein
LPSDSAIVSTVPDEVVHHSGDLVHRSAAHPESGHLHVGITGQLPPESLDNFDRNGWSTCGGKRSWYYDNAPLARVKNVRVALRRWIANANGPRYR